MAPEILKKMKKNTRNKKMKKKNMPSPDKKKQKKKTDNNDQIYKTFSWKRGVFLSFIYLSIFIFKSLPGSEGMRSRTMRTSPVKEALEEDEEAEEGVERGEGRKVKGGGLKDRVERRGKWDK